MSITEAGQTGNVSGKPDGAGGTPGAGVFSMTVPFAKGAISVQVRVTGDSLKPAHLARVRKYLELAEADFDSDVEWQREQQESGYSKSPLP